MTEIESLKRAAIAQLDVAKESIRGGFLESALMNIALAKGKLMLARAVRAQKINAFKPKCLCCKTRS